MGNPLPQSRQMTRVRRARALLWLTQGSLQIQVCSQYPRPRTRRQTATSEGPTHHTALSPSGFRFACPRHASFLTAHTCWHRWMERYTCKARVGPPSTRLSQGPFHTIPPLLKTPSRPPPQSSGPRPEHSRSWAERDHLLGQGRQHWNSHLFIIWKSCTEIWQPGLALATPQGPCWPVLWPWAWSRHLERRGRVLSSERLPLGTHSPPLLPECFKPFQLMS